MTNAQTKKILNGLLVRRELIREALDTERRSGRLTGHEDLVVWLCRTDRAVAKFSRKLMTQLTSE